MENIAQKLQDSGFPTITRWEVENNYRRTNTVSGEPSLLPLGAILAEIDKCIHLEKQANDYWIASVDLYDSKLGNGGEPIRSQEPHDSYIDTRTGKNCHARTPEQAAALLYIALKEDSLTT